MIEQAIKDNCFIINENEMVNYNENILDDFMNDVNNNLDAEIRIVNYGMFSEIEIIDIKYIESEKIYKVCIDNTRQKRK